MSQQSKLVTFDLTCPEPRAWLVLKGNNREARVIEMRQRHPNSWSASVDLLPGAYRCRYYCGDEQRVFYFGPAGIAHGIDCGLDTLISVEAPECQENRTGSS
jgi:hypothetical protein